MRMNLSSEGQHCTTCNFLPFPKTVGHFKDSFMPILMSQLVKNSTLSRKHILIFFKKFPYGKKPSKNSPQAVTTCLSPVSPIAFCFYYIVLFLTLSSTCIIFLSCYNKISYTGYHTNKFISHNSGVW